MAGKVPQEYIQVLLDHLDIVDVIGSRVTLKAAGRNFVACCPFHQEKTPSFSVSREKQFYHCFGCGVSGDAINFLIEFEKIDFLTAVHNLSREAGLTVPLKDNDGNDNKEALYKRELTVLLKEISEIYHSNLIISDAAKEYLDRRKISSVSIESFGVGYALPVWRSLVDKFSDRANDTKKLASIGMFIQGNNGRGLYDKFRDRIIFPIRDIKGNVVGFGGRTINDDKPKYLNSSESLIFSKGKEVFGLYEAIKFDRNPRRLMVVEGYMDVISLSQHGFHNAVAALGTSINQHQIEKLFKVTSEVIFCFDGDKAGINAARKSLETILPILYSGRIVKYLFLQDGNDPDSFINKFGLSEFEKKLSAAWNCSEYIFHLASGNGPLDSPEAMTLFAQQSLAYIQQVPDGLYKEQLLSELSRRTGLPFKSLSPEMELASKTVIVGNVEAEAPDGSGEAKLLDRKAAYLNKLDMQASAILIEYPELFGELAARRPDWRELQQLLPEFRCFHLMAMLSDSPESNRAKLMGKLAAMREFNGVERAWWDEVLTLCAASTSLLIGKNNLFSILDSISKYILRDVPIQSLVDVSEARSLTELEKQELKTLLSRKKDRG